MFGQLAIRFIGQADMTVMLGVTAYNILVQLTRAVPVGTPPPILSDPPVSCDPGTSTSLKPE